MSTAITSVHESVTSKKKESRRKLSVVDDLAQSIKSVFEVEEINLKPIIYPSKFYFKDLKKLKHVKFDKYLMLLENRNDYPTAIKDNSFELTPIPNFIAYLVLAIRSEFEEELKHGICFLDSNDFPTNSKLTFLAENIYCHCDTYGDVLDTMKAENCQTMFLTLLELLQKFEQRIVQVSSATMDFVRKSPIFQFLRPHDFVTMEQIHKFTTNCFITQGRATRMTDKVNLDLTHIDKILQAYYFNQSNACIDEIIQRNKFHQLLYHDLRSLKSSTHRYVSRFILRNVIYFIRRYIGATSSRLRLLRNESPKETTTISVPYINGFAIFRMSQFLALSCTEIKDSKDDLNDRISFLMSLLSVHMDNLWFRQQHVSNVLVSTEIEHCHENCPCGI